jgi:hypothetical protein
MLSLGSDWCPAHLKGPKRGFYKENKKKQTSTAPASFPLNDIWEASRFPVIESKGPTVKKGSKRTRHLSQPKRVPPTRNTVTPPEWGKKKVRRKKKIGLPPCESPMASACRQATADMSQSLPVSIAFSSTYSPPTEVRRKERRQPALISEESHLLTPSQQLKIESMEAYKTATLLRKFGERDDTEIFQNKRSKDRAPFYSGGYNSGTQYGVRMHPLKTSPNKISQVIKIR